MTKPSGAGPAYCQFSRKLLDELGVQSKCVIIRREGGCADGPSAAYGGSNHRERAHERDQHHRQLSCPRRRSGRGDPGGDRARRPSARTIATGTGFSVALARLAGRDGRPERHRHSARLLAISAGTAELRIGGAIGDPEEVAPGEWLGQADYYHGFERVTLAPGMVVIVDRDVPYQLCANGHDVAYLVVRIG